MSYFDPYELPHELFKKSLIPLSYEETLQHCRNYYIKNGIQLCLLDLWENKIKAIPENERQELFEISAINGYIIYMSLLLNDDNVDPAAGASHALRMAAMKGNTKIVELLLKDGRSNLIARRETTISVIIEKGYYEILKMLIESQQLDISENRSYMFRKAVNNNQIEIARFLLSYEQTDPSANHNEALCSAAISCNQEMLKLILNDHRFNQNANINNSADQSITLAVQGGCERNLKLLLKDNRLTPEPLAVQMAFAQKNMVMMRLLTNWLAAYSPDISRYLHNPTIKINMDIYILSTALKFACYHTNYHNIKILLLSGANPHLQNNYCFYIAKCKKDKHMMEILSEYNRFSNDVYL